MIARRAARARRSWSSHGVPRVPSPVRSGGSCGLAGEIANAHEVVHGGRKGEGVQHLLDEWQVLSLEASLRREQHRYTEALELLDRARAVCGRDRSAVVRLLLQKEHVFEQMGSIEAALAVTVAYTEGQWTVAASQGAKTLTKPSAIRASEALRMVAMIEAPSVHDAVEHIIAAERSAAENQALRLRQELADIEARLAELRDAK